MPQSAERRAALRGIAQQVSLVHKFVRDGCEADDTHSLEILWRALETALCDAENEAERTSTKEWR